TRGVAGRSWRVSSACWSSWRLVRHPYLSFVAGRAVLALELWACVGSRHCRARTPVGMSRERAKSCLFALPRTLAPGCVAGPGSAPRRNRLGRLVVAADDRRFPAENGKRLAPPARRVRRLALPEHAPGGRVRRGRGLHPVPPGDRRGLPLPPDGPIAGAGRRCRGGPPDRCRRRTPVRGAGGGVHGRAPRRAHV